MTEKEYVDIRLENQISWYDQKSQWNQKWYKRLRLLEISCAALIPFIAGIGESFPYYKLVVGLLAIIIAISAGITSIYKFHENWIQYRTTAETLKHEKYLYLTKCSPYNSEDAFCKLVQRVESLISKEHSEWLRYVKEDKKVS